MKIAIFLNTAWNIYNFRLSLLKHLQQEGNHIICIAPKDEYTPLLEKEGFEFVNIDIKAKSTNPLEDVKLYFRLKKILKNHKPDVLLNYTIKPNVYGALAARNLGIKTINNVSGLGTVFLRKSFSSKIAIGLYKVAFRFPEMIFFQNHVDRRIFQIHQLVSKTQTDVLPGSGVNLEKFIPDYESHFDDTHTFLMPARLLLDKGVHEYVAAAKIIKQKYPNVKFILVGKPDYDSGLGISREDLKSWIHQELIEYHGFTDNIKEYYHKVDCVVLPSYREGTAKTLLEALAMGKPIITTNTPGCRETVDIGVNGFLCKVKDVNSLADALQRFINLDNIERQLMAQASRKKAEQEFDENFVINKYKKAIFGF
ncbi:MAG: glycosyltransferase family 4 protein [Cytophagales bacterium]